MIKTHAKICNFGGTANKYIRRPQTQGVWGMEKFSIFPATKRSFAKHRKSKPANLRFAAKKLSFLRPAKTVEIFDFDAANTSVFVSYDFAASKIRDFRMLPIFRVKEKNGGERNET